MRAARVAAIALLAIIVWSKSTAADLTGVDTDGWHTWQVDAPEPVAEMCCVTWHKGSRSQKGCNLDGGRVSYGSFGDCSAEAGYVQFYALIRNGKAAKIRVLSSECPVSTETEITDHGVLSSTENLAWFRGVIEDRRLNHDVREEALFGLVQSGSDAAFEYIDRLLTQRQT